MTDLPAVLGVAVVVFASTNVDDVLLLAVFFADPRFDARRVVLGQHLGIAALVAASALAAWASLAVPAGWTALLGLVPLILGVRGLWALRRPDRDEDDPTPERLPARSGGAQTLAVAGVTVANGGDNLGVYVPLFAREPGRVALYALVFAVMTTVWCLAGYHVARHPAVGARLRRHGPVLLPFVLVALGLWILADARVLLP